jgi:hypothetical protein
MSTTLGSGPPSIGLVRPLMLKTTLFEAQLSCAYVEWYIARWDLTLPVGLLPALGVVTVNQDCRPKSVPWGVLAVADVFRAVLIASLGLLIKYVVILNARKQTARTLCHSSLAGGLAPRCVALTAPAADPSRIGQHALRSTFVLPRSARCP